MGGYRLYTIYTILISEKDGAVRTCRKSSNKVVCVLLFTGKNYEDEGC